MSGDASSSGQLHEARHYQFSRRMITPTFPTEGDHLKIETEEAIFGLIFAWMAFWLWRQFRGLLRYWREVKVRSGDDPTGVEVEDVDESDEESDEDEGRAYETDPKKKD